MKITSLKKYLYDLKMDPSLAEQPFMHDEVFSEGDTEYVIFEKIDLVNKILNCLYQYKNQTQQELLKLKTSKNALHLYRKVSDEE